ncbi:MAG TPA: ABC transporter substrate-binding protein [Alphaproteobacteria bacterium]|nr:ABC transporter substrate-binding protein [Alphaproteobacteria bacterium]
MDTRITRRRLMTAAGAGALGIGMVPMFQIVSHAQGKLTEVSLTLPWIPHGAYAAFIVARELGYWKKRGLDVTVSRGYGSPDALKRVGLGQFEYGDASFSALIQTVAQGMDLVGLGLHMQVSPLAVFSLKKKGIKAPKDLEGKIVGATPTTGDFHLFPAFAKAAGIDPSKIKWKFLDPHLRAQSLLQGDIDALTGYYSTDAAPLWVAGADIDIMSYYKYGIKMYDTGVFATRAQIDKAPEVTRGIVEGAMEGLKFTYLEPAQTLDIHIRAEKEFQGSEKLRQTVKYQIAINTALGLAPGPKEHGLGWFIPEEVQENVKIAAEYMSLPKQVNPSAIYTNKYLGAVKLTPAEWTRVAKDVKPYVLW